MAGARGPGRRGFAMQQGGDGDAARPSPVGDLGTDAPPGRHGPPPATSPVQGGSHGGPMPAGAAPQPPAAASGGPAGGQGAGSFWGDYGKGFNSSGPAAHPPAAQAPKASGPATASGEARRDGTAAQAALPTRSLQASLSSKHFTPPCIACICCRLCRQACSPSALEDCACISARVSCHSYSWVESRAVVLRLF